VVTTKVPFSNTALRMASSSSSAQQNTALPVKSIPSKAENVNLRISSAVQMHTDEILPPSPGVYTREALEAVGLGFSPSSTQPVAVVPPRAKTLEDLTYEQYREQSRNLVLPADNVLVAKQQYHQQQQQQQPYDQRPSEEKRYQRIVERPPPPPAQIIEPPKQIDTIDFNIVRCWDLPECLGGTNPYVLLNIPSFGQAKTACVFNSTQPYFGTTLSLNYPKQAWKRDHGSDDLVNFDGIEASVVQIFVYNKNQSISDEMVAFGEQDLIPMVTVKHSLIVDLYDAHRNPAGYVEIAARYRD
jgi:hypothetical protein